MKPADDPAWVDIPKVAQRIRIRPGAILGLVNQGALTGLGKVPGPGIMAVCGCNLQTSSA